MRLHSDIMSAMNDGGFRYSVGFVQPAPACLKQGLYPTYKLEIKNSDTGEPVYTAEEWKPFESDPYFTWLGKYTNKNHCVPDGYYDAKVYA